MRIDNTAVKNEKVDYKTSNKGGIKTFALSNIVSTVVSAACFNKIVQMQKNLTEDKVELLNKAGEKILKSTNLAQKGVQINDVEPQLNTTNIPDKLLEMINTVYATGKGKNAFFTYKKVDGPFDKNSVNINKSKGAALQFHELGHAFNYNNSAILKTIQKMRMPLMLLSSSLALFCAFTKNSEPEEGEELTKGQKAKNFIRKNSGLLAFMVNIPILAEEGMASIRGAKWAGELLPKDLAKHVNKTNACAYIPYLASAITLGFSAYSAAKAKDYFVEKQKAKQENNLNG